ncbi:unnamed protein product [Brassica rapa]|uniref:Uncharacterized protein n=2 Tax=Brassica TaxID=3705 RepID=A0A3P5ZHG4_BRACM|nr:unnamed protein product [Brassica napus]CAG7888328.1 unnamed protein product [Brassica rapa]VDC75755.1 unnamed protein product [Brassica rapa]
MHHHSETTTTINQPLCPKPRRVCPSLPDFLKPVSCSLHSSNCQQSSEGRSGVINIIDKPVEGGIEWYVGSPPKRTGNPLVHDLHFVHCHDLLPNFPSTKA